MKKLLSIVVSVLLIMPILTLFGLGASAESTYEQLWAEKIAYEKDHCSMGVPENTWSVYYELSLEFVLYTDAGKELSYEIITGSLGGLSVWPYFVYVDKQHGLTSRELYDIYRESLVVHADDRPGVCSTRKIIQALNITKEDMLEAYRRMKYEPESVRDVLSCLSDEAFEGFLLRIEQEVSRFEESPQPNFIISALFLEDEIEAQHLLSKTGAVYMPELGYALITGIDIEYKIPVEEIAQYDLTSKEFGYYLEKLRQFVELEPSYGDYSNENDGRTIMEKLEYLEAAREAQLKASETGDGAVSATVIVAIALPTLAVVTVKRKRRI